MLRVTVLFCVCVVCAAVYSFFRFVVLRRWFVCFFWFFLLWFWGGLGCVLFLAAFDLGFGWAGLRSIFG